MTDQEPDLETVPPETASTSSGASGPSGPSGPSATDDSSSWGAPPTEPPLASDSAGGGHRAALISLIVVCMIVAGVAGYAVTSHLRSGSSIDDAAATPPSARTPRSTLPPDRQTQELNSLVARQQDVGSGYQVAIIPNGYGVDGTTTLDLCNGTYPSEELRTARLQVAVADSSNVTTLSTEAVLYRNSAATQQAFREIKRVAAQCPNRPVTSPVGEPTVTTKFFKAPDGAWPATTGVERIAFDVQATDEQDETNRSIAVYLRRGRVLLGLYFADNAEKQPPVGGKATIPDIVTLFAKRVAALPASVVADPVN